MRNAVKLAGMTDDLLLLILVSAALAGGYRIWQTSLDAREAANRIAKDTCSRAVVQFLDGTVAFAGFRLTRDAGANGACCAPTPSTTPATASNARRASSCWPDCGSKPWGSRATHRERRELEDGGLNIDLHTHSNRSDGALAPAELVARAAAAGVDVLALTDHDTVAGLEEAQQSAGVHRPAPRPRR